MRRSLVRIFVLSVLAAAPAAAHDLWLNADAAGHDGKVVMVTSVGWGHAPTPLDEFLPGDRVAAFALVAPGGTAMPLPFDTAINANIDTTLPAVAPKGLARIQAGDSFARRIEIDAAAQGVWRPHMTLKGRPFSTWTTATGERRSGPVFAADIPQGTNLVATSYTVRGADAFVTVGSWMAPKPIGAPVELLPVSDISAPAVGKPLAFVLHRDGKPVADSKGVTLVALKGDMTVDGVLTEAGVMTVTLPEPGLWIVRGVRMEPPATAGAAYAMLEGRVPEIRFMATVAVAAR